MFSVPKGGVVVDQAQFVDSPETALAACRDILDDLDPVTSEAEAIDQLRALEEIKSATSAVQARTTAILEQLRLNDEAERGVPKARRGKGLATEIALARGDAPARGSRHLRLANALTQDLPETYEALRMGRIHEEHAQVVANETSWLSAEHRRDVDGLIAERLGGLGPRQLGAKVRGHAQRLDQEAAVKRLERARSERRVSVRPAPGNMAYLTALLPMQQAVAVKASLQKDATTMVGTGETSDPADPTGQPRTRDQIMADTLVERATGQTTAPAIPVEVQLVMSDEALFSEEDDTPAWLAGHGPIPADIAKQWLSDPDAQVFLRRIFTRPEDNQLVGLESRSREFLGGLRRMIILRDDGCRTPHCDAPIREIDHIKPARDGGATSWQNGSGLCAACNQTKENTGWQHRGNSERLEVTTPTGHRYTSETSPIRAAKPPDKRPPPPDMGTCAWSIKSPTVTSVLKVPYPEVLEAA